jgi:uncharacterized protein YlxW (UPF0749 family)
VQNDLDEMASEAKLSEEKAQRAMIDAARLADELRGEQEAAQLLERDRRLLEAQVKDSQVSSSLYIDMTKFSPYSTMILFPLPRYADI